ncbi:glycosyltransferase family 2 protein [Chryseobacterium manosquense]|uniref:Glycosyltransferase family 2 protein n=1 Tax=Chryseobacterium manosquense TaxID=2754694 RepID=A0A7H1DUG6_9FLAO|nr:glycosyltransferase family 2 protein [Chryseobacterium manosquense]QNS40624.1 glycosyltransferase family 2 protein [Chryseobacterium manosquense]
MKKIPFISIFTPTYNRAALLPRLYSSLKSLKDQNFEWIIVDDGSTDRTQALVEDFISEGVISIQYYSQANSGKHIAINKGAELARGELFFIVDSDDFLPENSLETIGKYYEKIKDNAKIAGICGKRKFLNADRQNLHLKKKEEVCTPFEFRFVKHYEGDMAEVIKTEVMRTYSFPKFHGEIFCTEALVWNRIGKDYDILYFDEFIYECEYQDDGLTSKYFQLLLDNPKGSLLYYRELLSFNLDKRKRKETLRIYNHIAKCNSLSKIKVLHNLGIRDFLRIYLP